MILFYDITKGTLENDWKFVEKSLDDLEVLLKDLFVKNHSFPIGIAFHGIAILYIFSIINRINKSLT